MLTPSWYVRVAADGGFYGNQSNAPRLDDSYLAAIGEIAYLFGDDCGFSPAKTAGATHVALLAAVFLKSTMDTTGAARMHDLTELTRLIDGMNLLHAYLTQTVQQIAAQLSRYTFTGLDTMDPEAVAAVRDSLLRAASNGELAAGHLKEACMALPLISSTAAAPDLPL